MTEDEMSALQQQENQRFADISKGYTPEQQALVKAFISKNSKKWALPSTGNLALDDYNRARDSYGKAARGGVTGYTPGTVTGEGTEYINQTAGNSIYGNKVGNENLWNKDWASTLTPAQQAEYRKLSEEHDAKIKRNMQLAAAAGFAGVGALGAIGAGGLGALGGSLGSGVAEGVGGAGMDLFGGGFGSMLPADIGNLAGGMFGATMDTLPGFSGALSGGLGALGGGSDWMDLIKQYGPDVLKSLGGGQQQGGQQQGGQSNIGGLLGGLGLGMGGLSLINQFNNRDKLPAVPDYMKLANMTGASANPNQINAQGDTLNWQVDPVTGQRKQTIKYSAGNQQAFDQRQAMAAALRNKITSGGNAAQPLQQVNANSLWG